MQRRRVVAITAASSGLVVAAVAAVATLLNGSAPSPVAGTSSTSATRSSPTTSSPTTSTPRAPLTGIPVAHPGRLDHPAVALKISNVPQAHPHVGVDSADIVFVEPIGVSYTRLLAVFHSHLPRTVGPVRSVRPPDAPLLGPVNPVFGNTMGAHWVVDYVDSVAHLDDLGTLNVRVGSGAYTIDSSRPSPDDVFAHPRTLLHLSHLRRPPPAYFAYAAGPTSSSAARAGGKGSSATVSYGPGWQVGWTYQKRAKRYARSEPWGPERVADGTRVTARNVVILKVTSHVGKIGTASGAPVPLLDLVRASGSLVALTGGHSVEGTWSKGGVNQPFEFRTSAGGKLELAPGNTWVEMPTPTAAVSVH